MFCCPTNIDFSLDEADTMHLLEDNQNTYKIGLDVGLEALRVACFARHMANDKIWCNALTRGQPDAPPPGWVVSGVDHKDCSTKLGEGIASC
jgi:hypothetical protein